MKKVTLLFLIRDNEILLAMKKRGFGQGHWNGCGGKIEQGETIEQAMIRETEEEICVTPIDFQKVAIHDFVMETHDDFECHVFLCTKWKGEPDETEEMNPKWFKTSEIPYDQMWQDDIIWLPAILNNKKLQTTFNFDANNNLKNAQLTFVDKLE